MPTWGKMSVLFRMFLDMVALQLDKLFESESAQSNATSRVLPSGPGKILQCVSVIPVHYFITSSSLYENNLPGWGNQIG